MWSTGGYPMGAECDPRAPWRNPDIHYRCCPDCEGKGHLYFAMNIFTRKDWPVTEAQYNELPIGEDEAYDAGQACCRCEDYDCPRCGGEGEIEFDLEDYYNNDDRY